MDQHVEADLSAWGPVFGSKCGNGTPAEAEPTLVTHYEELPQTDSVRPVRAPQSVERRGIVNGADGRLIATGEPAPHPVFELLATHRVLVTLVNNQLFVELREEPAVVSLGTPHM